MATARRPRSRLRSWGPISAIAAVVIVIVVVVVAAGGSSSSSSSGSGAIEIPASIPTSGVSKSQIIVGVASGDPASAAVIGAQPKDIMSRADLQRAWESGFVGNETINGRKVVFKSGIFQITDQTDPVRQCKVLTEDDHVFAVLTDQFVNGGAGCVAVQHHRPLIATFTDDPTLYKQGRGLTYSIVPSLETTAGRFVDTLAKSGELKGKRIGVLGSALGGLKAPTQNIMIPRLRKLGANVVASYYLSGDLGVIGSQIPVAVDAFRQAKVDLVLTGAAGPDVSQFANRAEEVDFKPKYILNDMGAASVFGALYPPSMNGAVAYTALREDETKAGIAPPASAATCAANFVKLGGKPLIPGSVKYADMLRLCGDGMVFVDAAKAAGKDLTVQSFTRAMQGLGKLDLPAFGPVSFGPGKVEGADALQKVTFVHSCPCFVPSGKFQAAG
jgi:Periplasmic binding protein